MPFMNVKQMLVPSVLTTILFVATFSANAAELAYKAGWTQEQFIITFWCPPPPTDQALAAVVAENYNLTWTPVEGLDMAAKHKLRAMLTSGLLNPAMLDDAAKRAQLDALIERVKNHPAMEAYFITDEPGAGAFPGLGKLVAYLRERDPAHLAYINLFPTYANEAHLASAPTLPSGPGLAIPRTLPASAPRQDGTGLSRAPQEVHRDRQA